MGVLNEITGKCALAIRLEIFFMANGRDESFFISKISPRIKWTESGQMKQY